MSSNDYRKTLNLPRTTLPMKANLTGLEPKILKLWEEMDIYQKLRSSASGGKKFILHDGPPYANGFIHIGHALNKILKDIVLKFKTLMGYDTPFIAGWDCHGLPVEHQLFKKINKNKHEVDVLDFRKKAKVFALKFVELQKDDFRRMGIFSDWGNPYLTLSGEYEYGVLNLLKGLLDKGYIYRGRKPVNWCMRCETALAEAEVEYNDKESPSIYFLFKVKDDKGIIKKDNLYFLVWTTTPWTLVSNVAVALHPDLEYGLYVYKGKNIILAKNLKSVIEEKSGISLTEEACFIGKNLEGMVLSHPFIERDSLLVCADFVSKDEGTGCVHIAPGHGQEDFSLVKKYNLDIIMPVDEKGVFSEETDFKGKSINQANDVVIDKLKNKGLLVKHEIIVHSYPHCWRCKQPVIFRATFQWFINVDHNGLRSKLLNVINNVRWFPSSGLERMKSMLAARPDWCISRQRLWGIPIPAVKCRKCGKITLNSAVVSKAADIFKEESSDSWFERDVTAFLPDEFKCPSCGSSSFDKEYDILDVWFESGASFLSVVKNNKNMRFPADMYLEGSDQHRGWFQVSLIPSVAEYSQPPFNIILTHGFVVDSDGRKMSKSLGNVIHPQDIIKKYGAEILRLWAAYSDYSEDVKISEVIIKQLVDIYRKVRNTIRFIMGNLYDFDEKRDFIEPSKLKEIDKYVLSKAYIFLDNIIKDYDNFSFYKVSQSIFNFCNLDLSSFYLDILKDRLYTYSQNSYERKSAQNVLYRVLKIILKAAAPILPFTAEEAFGCFDNWRNKKESLFMYSLAEEKSGGYIDSNVLSSGDKIILLRDEVLKEIEKKRESSFIGSSLEAEVDIYCRDNDYDFFRKRGDVLREVFIVSGVSVYEGDFRIEVKKAQGEKCLRCWNWRDDTGKNKDYPQICSRCVSALKAGGEKR